MDRLLIGLSALRRVLEPAQKAAVTLCRMPLPSESATAAKATA